MTARLLAIVALVIVNAFFVAAEFALVRARRARLEAMARNGDRLAAQALRALTASRRTLSTTQLGSTLSSLGLGWLVASWSALLPLVGDGAWAHFLRGAIALAVVAYLHIVLGELVPKVAALSQPEWMARMLAPPLLVITRLTLPFTAFLSWSAQLFTSRIRERTATEEVSVQPTEELRVLVERSQEAGALPASDATLLEGVLEFTEKSVREVMTPRTEIVAIPVQATLDDAMQVVDENGFSRYPAYEETIDNIVGLILAKDLIRVIRRARADAAAPDHAAEPMRAIMRPVHFVPATREVEEVLADFKRWREHLAIVLDEYGGTAGLVTMEDLLEEIVGPISDEYDEPEPALGTPRSGEILIPGDMSISDLNDRFGLSVPERDFATIGGFVFGSLGRVPRIGDKVSAGGATFTVREVDGRRAETLAVKLGEEK